jgi:hypothetical protein
MQRRLHTLFHTPLPLPPQRIPNPIRNLLILSPSLALQLITQIVGHLLVLVVFGDGLRFREREKPGVREEHAVGGAELGDLVQAGTDEVPGLGGVAFFGEVGGVAVDDCLGVD